MNYSADVVAELELVVSVVLSELRTLASSDVVMLVDVVTVCDSCLSRLIRSMIDW